jgi:hypothetical protein
LTQQQALVTARNSRPYQDIKAATYGIAFFATPHRGGNYAQLGSFIAGTLRRIGMSPANGIMSALKEKNPFIDGLEASFRHQLDDYRFISFYELSPWSRAGIVGIEISGLIGGYLTLALTSLRLLRKHLRLWDYRLTMRHRLVFMLIIEAFVSLQASRKMLANRYSRTLRAFSDMPLTRVCESSLSLPMKLALLR